MLRYRAACDGLPWRRFAPFASVDYGNQSCIPNEAAAAAAADDDDVDDDDNDDEDDDV